MTNPLEGLNFIPAGQEETEITEEQTEFQPNESQSNILEGLDFTPYKPEEKESLTSKIGRGAGRTVARSVETLAGLPGDVQSFIQTGVKKGIGFLVGQERAEKASEIAETITKLVPGMNRPGSQDVREQITQELTGEVLEPQTEYEELYDDIVSDFAALAVPIKGKIPFLRSLGTSIFSNLSAQTVKEFGAGEKTQAATKLGTMFLGGLFGRGGSQAHVRELHQKAEQLIPPGATFNATKMITEVDKFQAFVRKGGVTPSKTPALSLSRQLVNKIQKSGGDLAVDELPEFRKSINELRFDRNLPPKTKFFLDRFDDIVHEELLEYGKENPTYLKSYKEAQLGTQGLKQSDRLSNFISSKVDINNLSPEAIILLGLHANPGFLAKAGAVAATLSGAKIANRLVRNPVLRKYYGNVVKQSLEGNTTAMIRNLEGLDKELRK